MLDAVTSTRCTLADVAASFEPCTFTHEQAARLVGESGVIRRLVEGMLTKAAKRVADTAASGKGASRDAAQAYARAAGVAASEARRAMHARTQSATQSWRPVTVGPRYALNS